LTESLTNEQKFFLKTGRKVKDGEYSEDEAREWGFPWESEPFAVNDDTASEAKFRAMVAAYPGD
jgi:hypothetical protein